MRGGNSFLRNNLKGGKTFYWNNLEVKTFLGAIVYFFYLVSANLIIFW